MIKFLQIFLLSLISFSINAQINEDFLIKQSFLKTEICQDSCYYNQLEGHILHQIDIHNIEISTISSIDYEGFCHPVVSFDKSFNEILYSVNHYCNGIEIVNNFSCYGKLTIYTYCDNHNP